MKKKNFKKLLAFTCLVKPFAQIWTRAMTWQSSCTRNLRKPSIANAHSYGFTLAEVLITLSILGVVAAITVPSLIKRQHRNEVETKIRKMYSTLTHVIDTVEANEGKGFASWDSTLSREDYAEKYFIPYLNISKDCIKNGDGDSACSQYITYRQDEKTKQTDFMPTAILKDGIYVAGFPKPGVDPNYGSQLRFDINGPKGPNSFGKDIFDINVYADTKTGSYYFGGSGWDQGNEAGRNLNAVINYCKTEKSSGMGFNYCSTWIYANGIKIPKDYPWL